MEDWIVSSLTLASKRKARREAGEYIQLGYPFYSLISQVEAGLRSVPRNRMSDWAAALGVDTHEFEKNLLRPEVLH